MAVLVRVALLISLYYIIDMNANAIIADAACRAIKALSVTISILRVTGGREIIPDYFEDQLFK